MLSLCLCKKSSCLDLFYNLRWLPFFHLMDSLIQWWLVWHNTFLTHQQKDVNMRLMPVLAGLMWCVLRHSDQRNRKCWRPGPEKANERCGWPGLLHWRWGHRQAQLCNKGIVCCKRCYTVCLIWFSSIDAFETLTSFIFYNWAVSWKIDFLSCPLRQRNVITFV